MKTFKQYLNDKPKHGFLYNSLPNTHGSHSLNDDQKEKYNDIKRKRKKLVEYSENTQHVDDWSGENDNKHLGSNIDSISGHPQMEKLHELHGEPSPNRSDAREALENYTSDSRELNNSLINKTPYKGNISLENLKKNFTPAKTKFSTYSGIGYNLKDVKPVGKSKDGNNIYHSSCFTSSSISKQIAGDFAATHERQGRTNGVNIIQHHVEPGDSVCIAGNHSMGPEEREIIHPENTHYEHIGTTHLTDDDGDIVGHIHHFKRIDFNGN